MDAGILSIGNLELRRKVGYRPRKKIYHPSVAFLHQECRQNRTYEDFQAYTAKHSNMPYVEINTVKGVREQGKRMLTMHFVEQNILLIFLMRDGKGTTDVKEIEFTVAGERRTRVFYCDPQASW